MEQRRENPGVAEMNEASFGEGQSDPYPLSELIKDARQYLATRSYDSEERMVLRWCVDRLAALDREATALAENIEQWLATGVSATSEQSRTLYENLCAALRRDPYQGAPPSPPTYASETHKDRNSAEERPA